MSIMEAIRVAMDGIVANKLRSFLTTLGVIIGVGAVIALVSISEGASGLISGQIEGLGTNLLVIMPANTRINLTLEDATMLEARVPTLEAVAPALSARGTVKWGITSYSTTIEGVGLSHLTVRNYEIATGRWLSAGDLMLNRRVALVGQTVTDEVFKRRDPLGEELTVNGQRFTIIGTLVPKGESLGQSQDDVVMIPVTTAQRLVGNTRLTALYGQLTAASEAPAALAQIKSIFERQFGRADQVIVQSQDQLLETINTMTRTFSLMLGAIAGISLLVGGIGIMNIMLVSVTERTREIGLRKAVGAKRADILSQFLIEALSISLLGGLVGMGLGTLLAGAVARFGGWSNSVSANSVLLAVGFAAAIGVGFGLYPAVRAAALDPIQSLRYE